MWTSLRKYPYMCLKLGLTSLRPTIVPSLEELQESWWDMWLTWWQDVSSSKHVINIVWGTCTLVLGESGVTHPNFFFLVSTSYAMFLPSLTQSFIILLLEIFLLETRASDLIYIGKRSTHDLNNNLTSLIPIPVLFSNYFQITMIATTRSSSKKHLSARKTMRVVMILANPFLS